MEDGLKQFIKEHREDDVRQLALQASRYQGIDMPTALTQIAGWQSMCDKVPTWAACDDIIYPPHLPLEQCSSEATAIYKYSIVAASAHKESLVDLTGGFGIDCWFMSRAFQQTTYVERQAELVDIAKHNFQVLPINFLFLEQRGQSQACLDSAESRQNRSEAQLSIINCQFEDWLTSQPSFSWLFIDPARRDGHGGKTVAISDCEPDIGMMEEMLVSKASRVMVKLSPMLDLDLALHQLKHVEEAHIVAVDNECKELLLVLSQETTTNIDHTPIHCVNIKKDEVQKFSFFRAEEQQTTYDMANKLGFYLYEPNAAILKAGAYRCLAKRYGLQKLHANSHLYTANQAVIHFPGRTFCIESFCGFRKKELKALLSDTPKANLTIRNFPASVAELRKRLHIQEGGDTYLFATTLHPAQKILIKCSKP